MLRPVGPAPARVYWLRRAVLLLVVAVVVLLLARACSGGDGSPGAQRRPTPTPSASTSARPGPVLDCRAADLRVRTSTDAATYPAGVLPHLTAVVRNTGAQPCRFTTSPAARTWVIRSGSDRVWTSADCTLSGIVARARLKPGKTVVYGLVWNRHRSEKGCPASTPAAGPGTYLLHVTVNQAHAPVVVFHLTG